MILLLCVVSLSLFGILIISVLSNFYLKMKKSLFASIWFVYLDLTMESSSELTPFRVHLAFFLYFSQTLTPLFKLCMPKFVGAHDYIFPNFIFYTNFANFIWFLKNNTLFFLAYSFAIFMVFFPCFFCIGIAILKHFHKMALSKKALSWQFCQFFLENYDWIFVVPILETLVNPLDCDWYSFKTNCTTSDTFYMVTGIITIFWACLQSFFLAFTVRNFRFQSNRMQIHWNLFRFVRLLIRNALIVLFFIFKKITVSIYFSLHLLAVLAYVELFLENPIKNKMIHEAYLKYLCLYEITVFLMMLWSYGSIVSSENFFYLLIIFWILCYKFGKSLSNWLKNPEIIKIDQDISEVFCMIKTLQNKESVQEYFRLVGIVTNHFKRSRCDYKVCNEIGRKFMELELEFISNEKLVNWFIITKFKYFIDKKSLSKESKNMLILKYIDFLRVFVANPKKVLFVFEKSKPKIRSNSGFVNLYIKHLDYLIRKYFFDGDNKIIFEKDREQAVKIKAFFKMSKQKSKLFKMIRELLENKKSFWNDYLVGFSKVDNFTDKVQELTQKIEKFKRFVEVELDNDLSSCRAIYFKALSSCYSLFWNDVSLSIKYEEDFQKIYANELIFNQDEKFKLSFINKDIVICEASFMTYEGVIMNAAQNKNLASLFGFSTGELLLLKRLEALMPPFLGNVHKEFVRNFLNKTKTDHSKYPISSFAQHKNGFIFPIFLYFSIRAVKNDFVIVSAILHDEQNDNKLIVYNKSGEILGFSRKMVLNFQIFFKTFEINQFLTLNIFQCCPELKKISHENLMQNEFLLNQHANLEINMPETLTKNLNQNHKKKFEILFDLKILQHSLSPEKIITVFNMTIKSMEVFNLYRSQKTQYIPKELPKNTMVFQEEDIVDSPDAKIIVSKTPRLFMVKEKEKINCQKNENKQTIVEEKNNFDKPRKSHIVEDDAKNVLKKRGTNCKNFNFFFLKELNYFYLTNFDF